MIFAIAAAIVICLLVLPALVIAALSMDVTVEVPDVPTILLPQPSPAPNSIRVTGTFAPVWRARIH
jgi:hypothetical protein